VAANSGTSTRGDRPARKVYVTDDWYDLPAGWPPGIHTLNENWMRSDSRAWHGGRILVCEDNLLMADVVCEFVRECGRQPIGPVGLLRFAIPIVSALSKDADSSPF
jgi:hypothetical protein